MVDSHASPYVPIWIDGRQFKVNSGTTVAAAIANRGAIGWRRSLDGERRGPLCGMGVCFECRITIDGLPNRLACQTLCSESMKIETCEREGDV